MKQCNGHVLSLNGASTSKQQCYALQAHVSSKHDEPRGHTAPLYGEADAGRIWNRTLVRQLVQVQKFTQSQYDPCYFWKWLSDGTRLDIVMYVDDGYAVDATSKAAEAELKQLNDAFKLTLKPAAFFLGNKVVSLRQRDMSSRSGRRHAGRQGGGTLGGPCAAQRGARGARVRTAP